MKDEIEACLCASLEKGLDPWLQSLGFKRRKNTLFYLRKRESAVQKIEVPVEIHPKDRPDSAAAVYPELEVRIQAVNALVMEMTDGDINLYGHPSITLREPIAFTSGSKGLGARWFVFQPDSVPGIVSEIRLFLQLWTIPFLDRYSTPAHMCDAYDRADARVMHDLTNALRVAAAMVLCGRNADALGVMERWFGKPGPRRRYQRVFEYLGARR